MRYLIDGYNLLHATGHLAGKVGRHGLERARQAILAQLAAFVKAGSDEVTVVFDARRAPRTVEREQFYEGVHLRFALDREADDVIEDLIHEDTAPRTLTVVSDDRRLREAGRRRHCATLSCLDFYEETEKTPPMPSLDETTEQPVTLSEQDVRAWMKAFGADDDS